MHGGIHVLVNENKGNKTISFLMFNIVRLGIVYKCDNSNLQKLQWMLIFNLHFILRYFSNKSRSGVLCCHTSS